MLRKYDVVAFCVSVCLFVCMGCQTENVVQKNDADIASDSAGDAIDEKAFFSTVPEMLRGVASPGTPDAVT